jgi:uncharacterized SAM-binding protein YcdF (DUF218 family)
MVKPVAAHHDEWRHRARAAALIGARGCALFLGAFGVVNAIASLVHQGSDHTVLLVDTRPLPDWAAQPVVALFAAAVFVWALHPRMAPWRRRGTLGAIAVLAMAAMWNSGGFYRLWANGEVRPLVPVPLSLLLCLLLVWIAWAVVRPVGRPSLRSSLASVAVAGVCALLFPLALMLFFGTTSYARRADAVVVFGAQVHADGRLSHSLADRVRAGAQLYQDGLVSVVIMSGGRGDGSVHECAAMRAYAEQLGVPATAIIEDRAGVTTQATVNDTVTIFRRRGIREALAVSQFYHLARIKLAYERAGWHVRTVPARPERYIRDTPVLMAREVPAFWLYYLRALI